MHVIHYGSNISTLLIPLTTNDDYNCHRNFAPHYQLLQSILKIGSVLAERVGQGEVCGWVPLHVTPGRSGNTSERRHD